MDFFKELKIFVKHIVHWVIWFIAFTILVSCFGLKKIFVFGKELVLFLPSDDSLVTQVFNRIRTDLIPVDVELIVTNPMSAFLAQISLSLLLSFLITTPIFIYKIILYFRPALYPEERRAVMLSVAPLTLLFLGGAAYSYFFIIPATFKILYPFTTSLGVVAYFALDEFIGYVISLTISVGFMFLLPVFMVLLSWLKIIKAEFWKRYWKFAMLFFLIGSAIITPDGTGITMLMLFLPLMGLYFAGYACACKVKMIQLNKEN
jgi:sec-independent protein translocase protein TatC